MAQFLSSISATNGQVTAVTFAHPALADLAALSGVSKLLGSSSASASVAEIVLGAGLSMSGNTLTASGTGTVTSVGMTVPAGLAVAGSPITNSGTLALTWSGQIPNANGGTGVDTHLAANGSLLIGNGAGLTLAPLTAGSGVSITNGAGSITIAATGGSGTVTSVSGSGGTTGLTLAGGPITTSGTLTIGGTLNTASGGTGLDTHLAANGSLLIGNGAGLSLANLTAGTGIAITNGAGSIQISASGGTGTVTSVNASGGTTGLGFTGGPITTSGTLTLGGTLAVGAGGTGSSMAPTNGQLLIGNGTGYTLATLTAGANVTITNSAGGIQIAAAGGSPTGAAGGDLAGSYPNPGVAKLQGKAVSAAAPAAGQALASDGTTWTPGLSIDPGVWTSPPLPAVRSYAQAGGNGAISLALPAGTQDRDLLLAVVVSDYGASFVDPATPAGWTLWRSSYYASFQKVYTYYKVASGETGPYAFSSSGATMAGQLFAVSGASAPEAYSFATASGTSIATASVTTLGPQRLVFEVTTGLTTGATPPTITLSGAITAQGSTATASGGVDGSNNLASLRAGTLGAASAGATLTHAATISAGATLAAVQIAVPPSYNQPVLTYRGTAATIPGNAPAGQTLFQTDAKRLYISNGDGTNTYVGGSLASSDLPASVALTGTPTAPTAAAGTNTTQIATTAFVQSALPAVDVGLCEARLTLTSGTPVTATDVAGATTVYFTPYNGNRLALYTSGAWKAYALSEISVALGTLSSGLPYDVFVYDNAGTLTLQLASWTSTTARATALALQDGVWCKSGDLGKRYVGTFRTTSATTTEDSAANRSLWNAYNRVRKQLLKSDSTTYTYTTATWRQANNTSSNAVIVVVGLAESLIDLLVTTEYQAASTAAASNGIGEDSTTAAPATVGVSVGESYAWPAARLSKIISTVGYHFYPAMEFGAGTVATTWYGFTLSGSIDC